MDSGSDWDSLPGDDEPSFTLSVVKPSTKSYKQKKPTGGGKEIVDSSAQSPKQNDSLLKQTPTKKNQQTNDNKQTNQNTTVFVDRENYDYRTTEAADGFESVELEDKSRLNNKFDRAEERNKKKQAALGVKEKLPFTNFQVSSPDKKQQQQQMHKQQQQLQKQQQQQQNKKKLDLSNSWDMDDDIEKGVIQNNNILYGESYVEDVEPKLEKHVLTLKNDPGRVGANHVLKTRTETNSSGGVPSMLSLCAVKEKAETQSSSADNVSEQRYYYEKFYYNAHVVAIEDKSIIPKYADRLEPLIRRGWQEFFGLFRILFDFIVIFVIELLRLIFSTVFQKLIVGIITIIGDYLLKPLLSGVFNSILQPKFVFLWNTTRGIRRLLQPVIQIFGDVIQHLSGLLRSFRLFEYNNYTRGPVKTI